METNNNPGDGADHTALLLSYTDGKINDISGNSRNTVKYSSYSATRIHGICRPAYNRVEKENPDSGIISGSWERDATGWWYQKTDGSWLANSWGNISSNGEIHWYYFNESGYMATGWQLIEGKWYYLNEDPRGVEGALMTDTWIGEYYVNADGVWVENKKR